MTRPLAHLGVLLLLLAACAPWATPRPIAGHDWRLEVQVYRLRFGDPITSAVTATVLPTAAQITQAGMTITLDEWGGSKSATWTGLTGPAGRRARVWVDVQDAGAPGGWRTIFSGALNRSPSEGSGAWEALGDKYLRLREIPLTQDTSGFPDGSDVGGLIRALINSGPVALRLPHLTAPTGSAPDAGTPGKRRHNGESAAAALDGLISLKSGWGWTILPSDALYLGPPVTREALLNTGVRGVVAQLQADIVTEGLINAVQWRLTTPAGEVLRVETQHASVASLGYSGVTRFVDQRSLPALGVTSGATYDSVTSAVESDPAPITPPADWRDEVYTVPAGATAYYRVRATLTEAADWIEVTAASKNGGGLTVSLGSQPAILRLSAGTHTVMLPGAAAGTIVRVSAWDATDPSERVLIGQLRPRKLDLTLLSTAAEDIYFIPPAHVGQASEPGIQLPAGTVTVQRPGRASVTDKCVSVRYLLREPIRTEYLIGDTPQSADARALSVLIKRRDDQAVDQAVNT